MTMDDMWDSLVHVYDIGVRNSSRKYQLESLTDYVNHWVFIIVGVVKANPAVICFNVIVAAFVGTFVAIAATHLRWNRTAPKDESAHATQNVMDMAKTAYEPGHVDALVDIVNRKSVDVNVPLQGNGLTLFLCACISGQRRLVKFLLKKGADVKICTKGGDSALYLATYGVTNMASAFSRRADTNVLKDLIESGCDVNAQNSKGYTALHRAASKGNLEVIRCLLKHGANPTLRTATGTFSIDLATNAGHIEAAELLVIELDEPYVWDVAGPYTPSRIRLGLQTPGRKHLVESTAPRSVHRGIHNIS